MLCARTLRAGRCRAFTLIELFVVIAVVAILIAILLPALGRARRAGRQAVTLGRLRDIGIGSAAYANDYKDRLPTLLTSDERAFLGLSVLAKANAMPAASFINPNTTDRPANAWTTDDRPVLADLEGADISGIVPVGPGNIAQVGWHCSFSFDNDVKLHAAYKPIVYMGDRADYTLGRTFSANWNGEGMCLLWTDQHAAFAKARSVRDQGDPNIYHHNEFDGEGGNEVIDGVSVVRGTLDTHLRFFSEAEDDELLPD